MTKRLQLLRVAAGSGERCRPTASGTTGFISGAAAASASAASAGIGSGAIGAGVVRRRRPARNACMSTSWRPFTVVFATSHTMLTATASPRAVAGANFMR